MRWGAIIIKNIKLLIAGKDKSYIETIRSALAGLAENINNADSIESAFNELSNSVYDFFITDFLLFNKEFTVSSFTSAFPDTDLIIVASMP